MESLEPFPPIIVVLSLVTVTLLAIPKSSIDMVFKSISKVVKVPPVSTAISFKYSILDSPKEGAFTAQIFNPARK